MLVVLNGTLMGTWNAGISADKALWPLVEMHAKNVCVKSVNMVHVKNLCVKMLRVIKRLKTIDGKALPFPVAQVHHAGNGASLEIEFWRPAHFAY